MCVCVCVQTVTFELHDLWWHAGWFSLDRSRSGSEVTRRSLRLHDENVPFSATVAFI